MSIAALARRLGFTVGRYGKRPESWPAVSWRPATTEDWPPTKLLQGDLDWMRRTGTGYVSEFDGKRWFLFDRDWFGWPDPPEWGLASYEPSRGWRFFDDFDVLPENWIVPKVSNASN
jgi:hypothetical protein